MTSQNAFMPPVPPNYWDYFSIFMTRREFIQFEKRIDYKFESLHKEFNIKFDSLRSEMNRRFNAIDPRFNAVDTCFVSINTRFDAIDSRFDVVDTHFEKIEAVLNNHEKRFGRIETTLDDFQKETQTQFRWLITTILAAIPTIPIIIGLVNIFIK